MCNQRSETDLGLDSPFFLQLMCFQQPPFSPEFLAAFWKEGLEELLEVVRRELLFSGVCLGLSLEQKHTLRAIWAVFRFVSALHVAGNQKAPFSMILCGCVFLLRAPLFLCLQMETKRKLR